MIINIYFLLIKVFRLYILKSQNKYYPFQYRLNNNAYINESSGKILYNPFFRKKFKDYFFLKLIVNNKNEEPSQNNSAHCLNKNGIYIKWEISQNTKSSRNTDIYTIIKYIRKINFSFLFHMKNKKNA